MKIYISHAGDYDYESELYAPIKHWAPSKQHEFFMPHESQNIDVDLSAIVSEIDLVVAEVSYPSTGQGIELGKSAAAGIPIICFYRNGTKPSSSLRFITDKGLPYTDMQDLLSKLKDEIGAEGK